MENTIDNNKNLLIEILKNKSKPYLSKYTLEQLKKIYFNFIENKLMFKSDIVHNIIENNHEKIKEIINIHDEKTQLKLFVANINDLWENFPVFNNSNEIIDCVICLNNITNSNNITFQCNHITHSTCFLDYLFSNLKNIFYNMNTFNSNEKITKLFRCPQCRNYLTKSIENSLIANNDLNIFDSNIDIFNEDINLNENIQIEQEYLNEDILLQEYNLLANSLDDTILNNFISFSYSFEISNNNSIISSNNNRIIQESYIDTLSDIELPNLDSD